MSPVHHGSGVAKLAGLLFCSEPSAMYLLAFLLTAPTFICSYTAGWLAGQSQDAAESSTAPQKILRDQKILPRNRVL